MINTGKTGINKLGVVGWFKSCMYVVFWAILVQFYVKCLMESDGQCVTRTFGKKVNAVYVKLLEKTGQPFVNVVSTNLNNDRHWKPLEVAAKVLEE